MNRDPVEIGWLNANWHAPSHIYAGTTLRYGGISAPPFDQLNLGMHVNDNCNNVMVNREHIDATIYNATRKIFAGAEECFTKTRMGHWLMNLKQLVNKQLLTMGVRHIYQP